MPFVKGQSGNPSGKKKLSDQERAERASLAALARTHTTEALRELLRIARDEETPINTRVHIWQDLLDRGHGKPAQALDLSHTLGDGMAEIIAMIQREAPKP